MAGYKKGDGSYVIEVIDGKTWLTVPAGANLYVSGDVLTAANSTVNWGLINNTDLYNQVTDKFNKQYVYQYRTFSNPNTQPTFPNDYYGRSVASNGNYVAVGAFGEGSPSGSTRFFGYVYLYDISSGALIHSIPNPNVEGGSDRDQFGKKVAVSQEYIVGSAIIGNDNDTTGPGKVHIFDRASATRLHTIERPEPTDSTFGTDLVMANNKILVGSPGSNTARGKAYIYEANTAVQLYTLTNPGTTYSYFGSAVAMDDNYAVIGAPGLTNVLNAFVYVYDVNTGALVATLADPNTSTGSAFGYSVAISGSYIAVGAYTAFSSSGAVYVYKTETGDWTDATLTHTILNPNVYGGTNNDWFGSKVLISGRYLFVQAKGEDPTAAGAGAVYIFDVITGAGGPFFGNPYSGLTLNEFGVLAASNNYLTVGSSQYWEISQNYGTNPSVTVYRIN
jgi:hypothetical protein